MSDNDRTITVNIRALLNGFVPNVKTGSDALTQFGNTATSTATKVKAAGAEIDTSMKATSAGAGSWASSIEDSLKRVEASSERISHLWKSMLEAFIGFEMIKALKDVAAGAAESADALEVAARVAKNFGNSLNVAQMEAWLEKLAQSAEGGGYAINDMREAIQQFAEVGATGAQSQRLLVDAIGLAAAKHIDLSQAVHIAQMAVQGHYDLLVRYGILTEAQAKKVTSLSDVMKIWEQDVAGAAQTRAEGLTGAFGRLGDTLDEDRDKIGTGLTPTVLAVTNALNNLLQLVQRIPAPVLTVIATTGAMAIGLAALALALPAIVKLVGILGEGFQLLGAFGAPVITFLGRLVTSLGFGTGAFEAFTIAEISAAGPVALIVAAIVALIVTLTELVRHMDHVQTAWHDWTQYLSDSFAEFTSNVSKNGNILIQMLADVASAISNPAAAATMLTRDWTLATPKSSIKYAKTLDTDDNRIGQDIKGDWSSVWKSISSIFTGGAGHVGKTDAPWDGLGGDKDAKGNGQKQIDDALAAAKAVIDAASAAAERAVTDAKNKLSEATAALRAYQAEHQDQPLTPEIASGEQTLIAQQMAAQLDVKKELVAQEQAETTAAERYLQLAKSLPAADKDRVQHFAELNKAAQEHLGKVSDIKTQIFDIIAALAGLDASWRKVNATLGDKQYQDAIRSIDSSHEQTQGGLKQQSDDVAFQSQLARLIGTTPDALNQLAVRAAELAVEMAQDTVAMLQHKEAALAADTDEKDRAEKKAALDKKLTVAEDTLNKATNAYALTVVAANKAHTQWLASLISKVPGFSAKYNDQGQFAGVSIDPMSILMQAIEKSKSFADIMTVVNSIMSVFSQVIDALRPVIDALLEVVIGVVKVFIGLWNAIAHVLALLGIHIQMLELQNQADQTQVPLLRIYHDLPTLQEANSTAPMTLTAIEDSYTQTITDPLENALKDTSLGGGLATILGEILGVLVIIKALMALSGGSAGGGILGSLANGLLKAIGLGGGGGGLGPSLPPSWSIDPGVFTPSGDGSALAGLEDWTSSTLDPSQMIGAVQTGVSNAFQDSTLVGANGTVSQAVSGGVQDAAQQLGSTAGGAGAAAAPAASGGGLFAIGNIMSAISGGIEGFELGSVTSKMFGTDSPVWGQALGAAGGIVGGLLGTTIFTALGAAGGPVGALAGAILGSVIGGMIGPHWGPASNYPDRTDANGYDQFVADYTGAPGTFDGNVVNPQGPYNTAAGGESMTKMIEDWIGNTDPKQLSAAQDAIYNQLKTLGGTTGQLGIASERNGEFTLGSGQQIAVTAFQSLISQFMNSVSGPMNQLGANLKQMAVNIKNAADPLNELSQALTLAGRVVKSLPNQRTPLGGLHVEPGSAAAAPVTINLTHTGDINGYSGVQQLMSDLGRAAEIAFPNRKYATGVPS